MARPSTITRKEVFDAVAKLVASGEYPNPTNIRRELDNRGSPPLVQRLIGMWYAEFGPELARKATEKPPETPIDGLQGEIKRLTASALAEVDSVQAKRIAELDTQAAGLDARETDLLARERAQDEKVMAHAELLVDLRAQLAIAESHHDRLEDARMQALEEASAYRSQVDALTAICEAQGDDLERLRSQANEIPRLQATVEWAKADAAREQARVVELVAERDRLQHLAGDRATQLAKITGALERADAVAATQSAGLAALCEQLQDAQGALTAATVRRDSLTGELEQALTGRSADAQRIEALQERLLGEGRGHAVVATQLETTRAELARVDHLARDLARLVDTVRGLAERLPAAAAPEGSDGHG